MNYLRALSHAPVRGEWRKPRLWLGLCLFFHFFGASGSAQDQVPGNSPGAKIVFAQPIHDFGKVRSGETVKHTYTFTNAGNMALEVTNVQTSCGCAAAGEWTRRVEPGQAGTIPVLFNTAGYGGEVLKSVSVYSNDRSQPIAGLTIKGNVWKPIDVLPSFAVLNIMPDATSALTTVKITNNEEEHVYITSTPRCSTNTFTAEVRTNQPGKAFDVLIQAVPPFRPGNSQASITVTTSSTNAPTIYIGVWSIVQPRVSVIPAQVTLPPAPLTAKTVPTVTIQNNSTNLATVSEPSFPVAGVELKFNEVLPGRAYTVTLTFPQGFQLPPGEPPILSLKTTLPEVPVIKIPVSHLGNPAVTKQ